MNVNDWFENKEFWGYLRQRFGSASIQNFTPILLGNLKAYLTCNSAKEVAEVTRTSITAPTKQHDRFVYWIGCQMYHKKTILFRFNLASYNRQNKTFAMRQAIIRAFFTQVYEEYQDSLDCNRKVG